jgi:hypothetical protein
MITKSHLDTARDAVQRAASAAAEASQALIALEYERPDDRSVAHANSQAATIADDLGYLLARVGTL